MTAYVLSQKFGGIDLATLDRLAVVT